jgi:hypothetical protein
MSEFSGKHLPVEVFEIANARITRGEIDPSPMSRRDFTDLIPKTVEQAPDFCPECERLFDQD